MEMMSPLGGPVFLSDETNIRRFDDGVINSKLNLITSLNAWFLAQCSEVKKVFLSHIKP